MVGLSAFQVTTCYGHVLAFNLEYLPDFGLAYFYLFVNRLEHSGHRRFYGVDNLVNYVVNFYFHALFYRQFLGRRKRRDKKSDYDGVRRVGKQDVGFSYVAHVPVYYLDAYIFFRGYP